MSKTPSTRPADARRIEQLERELMLWKFVAHSGTRQARNRYRMAELLFPEGGKPRRGKPTRWEEQDAWRAVRDEQKAVQKAGQARGRKLNKLDALADPKRNSNENERATAAAMAAKLRAAALAKLRGQS
jgi:hypothetical protein